MHIVVIIAIIILIWALIEQKLLVTTCYTIKSAKLPKQFYKTRFVVLADLHNRTFGRHNERLIKQIEKLSPDFILVAGDMINKKEKAYPGSGYLLLEHLALKYKIYYAYGNHEQRLDSYQAKAQQAYDESNQSGSAKALDSRKLYNAWLEYKEKLTSLNVVFLDNQGIDITKRNARLHLTGITIEEEYFQYNQRKELTGDYLTALTGEVKKQDYQILIAHNPVYFKNYTAWGADLIISGHMHGGMLRIPGIGGVLSPQAKFFPKYDSGRFSDNGKHMIVSRGLGSHSIMPRLFNIPELVFVDLEGED